MLLTDSFMLFPVAGVNTVNLFQFQPMLSTCRAVVVPGSDSPVSLSLLDLESWFSD
jgi:hypothetical protein